jgi:REP element-mobilizing transposase RayT
MPRQDHPGAWHHVFHRGARHGDVFVDDPECVMFLDVVHEAVDQFGMEVHAYALIPNHYHLVVRVPHGNLSVCMQYINGVYTQRINVRHGWDGPLFRGRFGSKRVADETWLTHLLAYVHLNPVKAGLVNRPDEPCWTSHRAYLGLDKAQDWLTTHAMVERLGSPEAIDDFVRNVYIGREPWPTALNTVEGWLRPARLLPMVSLSTQRIARDSVDAERVFREVRRITGLSDKEILVARPGRGGNPARRFLVWALRRGKRMSHSAIGELLSMTPDHVTKMLSRLRRDDVGEPIGGWQRKWQTDVEFKCD